MVFRRSSSKSIAIESNINSDASLRSLYPQQQFLENDTDTTNTMPTAIIGNRSRTNTEESIPHPNQGPIIKLTSAQPKTVPRAAADRAGSPRSSSTWRKQYTPTDDAPESPFYSCLARGEDPTLLKIDLPSVFDIETKTSDLV
eukprot:CAMPEP_0194046414 /NCGR_PEP_ID=MMETSP0009_2-20130614/21089_1 /TAXON_ID=210454 /ORGANISM="Grammatophora oceanica, Strain CCMP 410" /LENGTH=142 /DNA_ID=CAMNT_0038691691 /DNA_START=47 /DNA_END=475 /DNA_ORIENTATION=+